MDTTIRWKYEPSDEEDLKPNPSQVLVDKERLKILESVYEFAQDINIDVCVICKAVSYTDNMTTLACSPDYDYVCEYCMEGHADECPECLAEWQRSGWL